MILPGGMNGSSWTVSRLQPETVMIAGFVDYLYQMNLRCSCPSTVSCYSCSLHCSPLRCESEASEASGLRRISSLPQDDPAIYSHILFSYLLEMPSCPSHSLHSHKSRSSLPSLDPQVEAVSELLLLSPLGAPNLISISYSKVAMKLGRRVRQIRPCRGADRGSWLEGAFRTSLGIERVAAEVRSRHPRATEGDNATSRVPSRLTTSS